MVSAEVSYHIVVIGEVVYKLTKEFKQRHEATPRKKIEGMRHVIVHGYYVVSKDFIWKVVEDDLPTLRQQIRQYITELEEQAVLLPD